MLSKNNCEQSGITRPSMEYITKNENVTQKKKTDKDLTKKV